MSFVASETGLVPMTLPLSSSRTVSQRVKSEIWSGLPSSPGQFQLCDSFGQRFPARVQQLRLAWCGLDLGFNV